MNNKGSGESGLLIALAILILAHNFVVAYCNINHHKVKWSSTGMLLKRD